MNIEDLVAKQILRLFAKQLALSFASSNAAHVKFSS
jgi:hypothetical protein